MNVPNPIQRDWLSRILAALLLGFTLALGCTGLFSRLTPYIDPVAKTLLDMWLFMPVWLLVLGGCFFFRNGWRTWFWLGTANVLVFALLGLASLFS